MRKDRTPPGCGLVDRGEPFRSISQGLARRYGDPHNSIRLTVPAHNRREYALTIYNVSYGGEVTEIKVSESRLLPQSPVTYSYSLIDRVEVASYRDLGCTVTD